MLWIFRKSRFEALSRRIDTALGGMEKDIYSLQDWIRHLHDRDEGLKKSHQEHIVLTKRDITHLNSWIKYLYKHMSTLHGSMKQLGEGLEDIRKTNEEMSKKLKEIESNSHFLPVQPRAQLKAQPMAHKPGSGPVLADLTLHDVGELSPSEKALIMVLYTEPIPSSYHSIASKLGLNYTTVKNLMYKAKKKGFVIKSRLNEDGEKEFYLDKAMRIKVSGR
ncbi:MAG: hypothetical protein KJ709_08745 [Nanoarchaeota archaeon]|nr:hypothetical protein [Nanoarchaeota archaeon]